MLTLPSDILKTIHGTLKKFTTYVVLKTRRTGLVSLVYLTCVFVERLASPGVNYVEKTARLDAKWRN